jgi:O-antigen/teichoic acid export membrane protein
MSVRRHTVTNLAGYVVPMFVTVVTVPLYLKALGDVRYGVLALVWLVLGYFSFLEMGLGKATANQLSQLRDSAPEQRDVVFWTAITVNGSMGMVAALILWIVGALVLSHSTSVPAEYRAEILAAVPWMVATLPLAMVSSVLNGALEGRSRFFAVNALQVATTVVFQLVPLLVALFYSPSLAYVIPAAVISRAVMNVAFFAACVHYVPVTLRPRFAKTAARSLLSFGGWVAVGSVASAVMETADRLVIGAVLGPRAVTQYTVPYQLVGKARVLPGSLARALFPRFSSGDKAEVDRLASMSFLALLLVMTPMVVLAVLVLHPFMTLWVGKDLASIASPLGEIMLLGLLANSVAQIPSFLLQGKGRPGVVSRLQLIEFVPFLAALWAALHYWGLKGAAWAWAIRMVVDSAILYGLARLPPAHIRAMLISAGLCVAAVFGVQQIGPNGALARVALAALLIAALYVWIMSSGGKELVPRLMAFRSARPLERTPADITP